MVEDLERNQLDEGLELDSLPDLGLAAAPPTGDQVLAPQQGRSDGELTRSLAQAMEFFAAVHGWTYFEMPSIGHGIRIGGRNSDAAFTLSTPSRALTERNVMPPK